MNKKDKAFFKDIIGVSSCDPDVFTDGLFGRGAECAWQFRINMLGQLAKKHNEDIK